MCKVSAAIVQLSAVFVAVGDCEEATLEKCGCVVVVGVGDQGVMFYLQAKYGLSK